MFNAERTIAATLDSICRQTYAKLDVVVVDDGSTDRSAAIVAPWRERDPRVRLVDQANQGVAAARNTGAASTTAGFLAFIDADDLWAPTKIEYQMKALAVGGPAAGLAYCWFAAINAAGRVVSLGPQPLIEGDALQSLCSANWIGNGSSILVRRAAFEKAGGYDASLRARRAQGAEDLHICLRVAEHTDFRVVPRYLVGYRQTPGNMSSNSMQMFRSTELVLAEFNAKYPDRADDIDHHLQDARHWFAYRAAATGRIAEAATLVGEALVAHPVSAALRFAGTAFGIARGRLQRRFGGRPTVWPLYAETIW